ncbi:MAG: LysR family transcriptional regulator [Bdellovibrionales bacterium]
MNLRRLEYFHVLAQIGNVRRASEMLNVSPPALSKAMRVLEDEMEAKLWQRDGRRIHLTDAGKRLLKRSPNIIQELRGLRDSLHGPEVDCRTVRIATFEVFSTYFLAHLDRMPWEHLKLEMHEVLPGELERHVSSGEVDYGITYIPVAHPELDFLKVTSIEMGVFTRVGAFPGVAQKELPFVVPISPLQGSPTRVRGLDGWPEDAYVRKIQHQVTLMETALELCRQGRAAGYFPAFIVEKHNERMKESFQLERRRSPYPSRTCRADVFLVKRKSEDESATAKQLARALRQVGAK